MCWYKRSIIRAPFSLEDEIFVEKDPVRRIMSETRKITFLSLYGRAPLRGITRSEKQNDAIDPDNAYGVVNLFPGIVVGHTLGQNLYLHVASTRGITYNRSRRKFLKAT